MSQPLLGPDWGELARQAFEARKSHSPMSETPDYYPLGPREEMMRDLTAMQNECDLVEARLNHCINMDSPNDMLESLRDTLAYKRAIREEIRTRLFQWDAQHAPPAAKPPRAW